MDSNQAKLTAEQIKSWDVDKLLDWIQHKLPNQLKDDTIKKLKKAGISGRAFLKLADKMEFFNEKLNLSIGLSLALADLASEIVEGETAGIKSMFTIFMPHTPRRQQADNVTGNRQQAEDEELSYSQSRKSLAPFIC
jgi:hypothetical protein